MKFKNKVLAPIYENHCLHLEILDKIVSFFGNHSPFSVDPNDGDIVFVKNDIQASISVNVAFYATSICMHFILADYEDFNIVFFYDSHTMMSKPKGLPKELECFFEMAKELREYLASGK